MKTSITALLLMTLMGCSNYAPQNQDSIETSPSVSSANSTVKVKTVTVEPEKVDCIGVGPMQCLVVDGNLFYDGIQGFNFESGYEYRLTIEQRRRVNAHTTPADANLYEYHLVEVLSKTKHQ
ncbi:DUF4377 domain-containing protein [Oceanisphaera pacifica]|uniref:DUF4377 domain-containing protein n=1 Tax=Oceanisphaera pacifica TaxID=2818389 RepID=A0ABS3NG09_9GAMM|nr:DUF4377 domain-containing protein [Oceanisphaera pacifica]MBO1519523.1 DUF4377 domain-containing protein [Oceanisphaera pacifica]